MKDYYQILRIKRTASEAEIKKAFRGLAVKYHPDKNPKNNTVELFQEINEAYETLSDTERKWAYDQRYDYYFSSSSYKWNAVKETGPSHFHNTTRPTYAGSRPKYAPKPYPFGHFAPFFRKVNFAGLALCFLLLCDFLLTVTYPNQQVTETEDLEWIKQMYITNRSRRIRAYDNLVKVNTTDFQLKMSVDNALYVNRGDVLDIYKTPFFRIVRWVELKNKNLSFPPHYGIYNSFLFIPIIMLIFSLLGIFVKTGPKFTIDMGIGTMIFMIITGIFIIIS